MTSDSIMSSTIELYELEMMGVEYEIISTFLD